MNIPLEENLPYRFLALLVLAVFYGICNGSSSCWTKSW